MVHYITAVPVHLPRQVKRFGPKKPVVSGNKSGHSGSATCSGLANDGVSINIEDCCQMTLCETVSLLFSTRHHLLFQVSLLVTKKSAHLAKNFNFETYFPSKNNWYSDNLKLVKF